MKSAYKILLLICTILLLQHPLYAYISPDRITISKKVKDNTDKDKKSEEKKKKKEPINESEFSSILVGALLSNPQEYLGKKIKIRGKFSSFSTLALDYPPALRSSKEYISLCLFRNDSKIPLGELKLAFPVEEAKEDPIIRDLQEGDVLELYGQVFSTALEEPWVDILSLKKIASAPSKTKEKNEDKENKTETNTKDKPKE